MEATTYLPPADALDPTAHEGPPSTLLAWLEGRAGWELTSLPFALPLLMASVPCGDGHPVLVLPGLMADDASTVALRGFLASRGYAVQGWGQGLNRGPRAGVFDAMQQTLSTMYAHAQRTVSVIGWSLGGVYAREIARAAPAQVRQVITLGSPLYGDAQGSSPIAALYRLVSGLPRGDDRFRIAAPPPVPTTSIYTRTDGVVGWGSSVERTGALTDNIEINSASHSGLGVNPLVWYAIGHRLAQPEGEWTHFAPRGLDQLLFPCTAPKRITTTQETL